MQVGLRARLISQAMRKVTAVVSKNRAVVIFINQLREKVVDNRFGLVPEVTPGGRALKFVQGNRGGLMVI
ncbi:RecA/RadA recombinase [Desulfofundulus luciae]|uniref:Protein RecA n=1 Tax=Desulfofundulus luciae TaxID=74702 RepID=A0ABU0B025_9FIRM|nr:RecA/RadA recombinase [Desulfofundulus luciae]